MKNCISCNEEKPLKEYHKDKNSSDGRYSYCKICVSIRQKTRWEKRPSHSKDLMFKENLKKRYGIGVAEYDAMFIAQNGLCGICGMHQSDLPRRLSVDHSHVSGKVRGLLCNDCNLTLGRMKDDVVRLKSAIEYIAKFS